MTTTFRPATSDDAQFLGWAMFMAARGHLARGWFDIVLRRPEEFCVAFCARLANANAKSWWHHSFFTVAEVDGKLASAACAFADSAPYMVSGEAMAEASDRSGIGKAEQDQLWPRGSDLKSTENSHPPPARSPTARPTWFRARRWRKHRIDPASARPNRISFGRAARSS